MWTEAELIEIKDVSKNSVRFILNYIEKRTELRHDLSSAKLIC